MRSKSSSGIMVMRPLLSNFITGSPLSGSQWEPHFFTCSTCPRFHCTFFLCLLTGEHLNQVLFHTNLTAESNPVTRLGGGCLQSSAAATTKGVFLFRQFLPDLKIFSKYPEEQVDKIHCSSGLYWSGGGAVTISESPIQTHLVFARHSN